MLQETLSHAADGRTILTGTPKSSENHLEAIYSQSTQNEWGFYCETCQAGILPDERCLGPRSLVCSTCKTPPDPRDGKWFVRNPTASWGEGFWVNHLMVPWLRYTDILERQRTYDLVRFKK